MASDSTGFLIMRLGLGAAQLAFAAPRLLHGAVAWAPAGRGIPFFSAAFADAHVGLAVLVIQVLAAAGLISGYLFRLSSALLASLYAIHFLNAIGSGFKSLPLTTGALACVCLGLFFTGPGGYAVAVRIKSKG